MPTESRARPASAAKPSGLKPTLLGSAFYYLFPVRRGVVLRNMRQVFGECMDDRELKQLARCYYSHFFKSIVENLAMFWTPQRRLADKVEVAGAEHLHAAAEQNKGILLLTGHFGNWELASIGAMLQFGEYRNRFHVIRKSLSAGLEQLVFGRSLRAGLKVIPRFDALGSIAIGILLGVIAVVLAVEMKSLLIGESAEAGHRKQIAEAIEATDSVERLIHLRTQHIGPDEILVAAKVVLDPTLAGRELADAIDRIEVRIRDVVPISELIFIEPDVYRPDREGDAPSVSRELGR